MIWHSSEIGDVLKALSVDDKKGLANGIADMRLEQYGKNAITNVEKPTFKKRFFAQLNNKIVIGLIVIVLLSVTVSLIYGDKDFYSPLLIIAIVLINALISAYHLYNSDNALNALKSISNPSATVLRDGIVKTVSADELVPGDILLLEAGDYIAADARIIESTEFRCNESALTGEIVPVEKRGNLTVEDIAPLEKRINMVYSGCSVIHGTAKAVVVAIGLNTETGHTSAILQQTGKDTLPLQSALDNTGKIINIVILVICALVFLISMVQNFSSHLFASMTVKMLVNATALAVAAIPEGLPAIATIVIALGISRIIKDNIIVKNTDALELLGKTSVICSDKTGILTRNKMSLSRIYDGEKLTDVDEEEVTGKTSLVLQLAAACSTLTNDSTEHAIEKACLAYNSMSRIDIDNVFPRLNQIPFDSERKTMTTINMINERPFAIVKGAPEILIGKCVGCNAQEILKINEAMAEEALRIVCIALKPLDEIPANPNPAEIESGLTFVGLLGLIDPPRAEAIESVKLCDRAGITTIMVTGDNLTTAKAIARRIGIFKNGTQALSGDQLSVMTDEELAGCIEKYSVYARLSPSDKSRIVKAWQSRGKIVTITGDSVSDADALALADVGCAMGKNGTDVAKGSADIIIANNSFMSVVAAIKESRGLFENIRKSVSYLLSCNFGEILAYIAGMLIFGVAPLAAVQLLWINLLTDCAPAISLSMEKAEDHVMLEKPVTLLGHIFDSRSVLSIALESVFIALMTILSYMIGNKTGQTLAMTMAFTTLGIIQIFHSYNIKTVRSIIKTDFKSNEFMTASTVLTLFIILFLVFSPAGFVFGLTVLSIKQFFISFGLAFAIIPFCEILKLIDYLRNKH